MSEQTKHTPGPWTAVGDGPYFVHCGEHPRGLDSPGWICDFVNDEADARLIAAAPELLEIVQRLGVYLPAELQSEVNAVLAKAMGAT